MSELPASWGLTTTVNAKGNAEVWGTADNGDRYHVRTCSTPEVTDGDIAQISECDRERYTSTDAGARQYVARLVEDGARRRLSAASAFQADLEEAAGPVVRAGLEREKSTAGYSRRYAQNYDKVFGGN